MDFESENLERFYFPIGFKEIGGVTYFKSIKVPNAYVIFWNENDTIEVDTSAKGRVYSTNYQNQNKNLTYTYIFTANVSYLYNYEGAPNSGYYWVDTYDKSVISFIPPEPTREDYEFGGWYKNKECTTAWDFENDITGEEIAGNVNYDESDERFTFLYAKWTEV